MLNSTTDSQLIMSVPAPILLLTVVIAPLFLVYGYVLVRRRRSWYYDKPSLPSSLIWGSMAAMSKLIPQDRHFDYGFVKIAEKLNAPDLFFLDTWPLFTNVCVIGSHEVAEQVSRPNAKLGFPYGVTKTSTFKHLIPVFGAKSLITLENEEWKVMRKRFNPGFQPKHVASLTSQILREVLKFVDRLAEAASTEESLRPTVRLSEYVRSLGIDIVGAVMLSVDFGAQKSQSHIAKRFCTLLEWQHNRENLNPFHIYNPIRPVVQRWNQYHLDNELRKLILAHLKSSSSLEDRDIVNVSLKGISDDEIRKFRLADLKSSSGLEEGDIINVTLKGISDPSKDPFVIQFCIDQLKTFLFAGHDTTATLVSWCIYCLSVDPEVLNQLRAEHDAVFGAFPTSEERQAATIQALQTDPEGTVGKLVFTTACLKETLRVHPPAGTARMSHGQGLHLTYGKPRSEGGHGVQTTCVDNHELYVSHYMVHHDKAAWGEDADVFRPSRWLDAAYMAKIPAGAYRPFERGPRNCIGQDVAMLETKIVLTLLVRRFNFVKVGYDGKTEEEIFNVRKITAKPKDGMAMRVFERD